MKLTLKLVPSVLQALRLISVTIAQYLVLNVLLQLGLVLMA
jgi:hypothetical protein